MDICDDWGEGSGLEIWDTDCNSHTSEKYSGVVNDSLQSKLDQDDPKLWSNFNISVNFNLMIVLIGLSILFINFVIIGVVVLICRLQRRQSNKKWHLNSPLMENGSYLSAASRSTRRNIYQGDNFSDEELSQLSSVSTRCQCSHSCHSPQNEIINTKTCPLPSVMMKSETII